MNIGLISQLLRGYWMIRPSDVLGYEALVYRLLTEPAPLDKTIFSKTNPIPFQAFSSEDENFNAYDQAGVNSTAIISMSGTMLKNGTLCSYGTTEVAEMIAQAANHKNISSLVFCLDSGGGAVDAIAPLVDAVRGAQAKGKPVVACCDCCASAAYWVAAACDRIVAANDISSEFGSIGVMCSFVDTKPYYEKEGYKFHDIYSSLSQHKNEAFKLALEGKYEMIKEEALDPLARAFQDHVRASRPNLKEATPGLLSGKMFFASEALAVGLIDMVGSLETAVNIARDIVAENIISNYLKS